MKAALRILALLIVMPSAYSYMFWLLFAFIPVGEQFWIRNPGSLLCAIGIGRYVWTRTGSAPDKLVARIAAGGNRSLGLSVRNTSRNLLYCTATLVAEGDSSIPEGWITIAEETFVLDRLQSACLPMAVRVPAEATGTHSGMLVVEAVGAEGEKTQTTVPVELTVAELR